MIDSHTHIYLSQFDHDREEMIERALSAGVKQWVLPSIDSTHFSNMELLEKEYPDITFLAMGLHPCSVKENWKDELQFVEEQLVRRRFSAIGEIGIDTHWDTTFLQAQKEALRIQCQWALEYNLPVILHIREGFDITFEILEEFRNTALSGVFHCFTGSEKQMNTAIDLGFKIGIGGVVTYKSCNVAQSLNSFQGDILQHILLETDAPYLSPVPRRGKRNEPANLEYIARFLSSVLERTTEEIILHTSQNSSELFRL